MEIAFRLFGASLLLSAGVACFAQDQAAISQLPKVAVTAPTIPEEVQGNLRQLNEKLRGDLPPAENAAVYLIELFDDGSYARPLVATAMDMLGIQERTPGNTRFLSIEKFSMDLGPGESGKLREELREMNDGPWTASRLPLAAKFLSANSACLDSLEAISKLRGYYAPVLSEEVPPQIISADLGLELRVPMLSSLLAGRALLRAGEGNPDQAVRDLLTCHRLARQLSKGAPFDVSAIKAHLIDSYACHAIVGLVQAGKLPAWTAENYLQELARLPPLLSAAAIADNGERELVLQELENLKESDTTVRDYLEIAPEKRLPKLEMTKLRDIDWTLATARAMEIHDMPIAALRMESRNELIAALAKFEELVTAWAIRADELSGAGEETLEMDVPEISRWIGQTVAMSLRTNGWQRHATDEREQTRSAVVRAGLALVVYAARHDSYPEKIEQLREVTGEVPVDAHTGLPLKYRRDPDGKAVLISWGINGEDDDGRIYNDDTTVILPPIEPKKTDKKD